MNITNRSATRLAAMLALALATGAVAADAPTGADPAEMAKKLSNPIASLISLPLQFNYDSGYGFDDEGSKSFLNIQPVIPISLTEDWNVISRTILPVISQEDMPYGTEESGIGDVLQSLFFSPKAPSDCLGLIWGVGPAILLPTATDERLGGEQWAAGPTAVVLKQTGPWTLGFLGNHLWSFAGDDDRDSINVTYLQPFVAYLIKPTVTTISLNTESTYNWEADESDQAWSVPINLTVNQMFKIGNQLCQFGIGPRYWVESPDGGPEGWGFRMQLTFLFPK